MDGDPVGARLEIARERLLGPLDHQVHVERKARRFLQGFDDRRPDRQARHEMPVHDIHVDEVRSSLFGRRHRLRQPCKVGGQDGGRDAEAHRPAAEGSPGRETVRDTTSRVEMGEPAAGNCLRTVFAATPS